MSMTFSKRKKVLEQGGWLKVEHLIPDHGWKHPEHGGIMSEDDALSCEQERLETRLNTDEPPDWLTREQMDFLEEAMRSPNDPFLKFIREMK